MKTDEKIDVIAIAGPTASGKTAYSVALAKEVDGEIISCDSMQVYRGMDIGTAKVTAEEMEDIPHFMLDVCEPFENFSVAMYCKMASKYIREIASRGKIPIVTGGTGLYMDSLLNSVKFVHQDQNQALRREIILEMEAVGTAEMHRKLGEFDPRSAERVHQNDAMRIARAFEVYRSQGITISEAIEKSKAESPYRVRHIGLNYRERETLYGRIDLRVELMMEQGLVGEVEKLLLDPRVREGTAIQGIGYKEILRHMDGEIGLDEAVEIIKRESRRYAKRQITWFRREASREWIFKD